jgi:hypothetical protein
MQDQQDLPVTDNKDGDGEVDLFVDVGHSRGGI